MSKPSLIPQVVSKWGESVEITPKGAVFSEGAEKLPPSTIIELLGKLAKAETACSFAQGDLVNFLVGVKGKDLREIADATGVAAADLKRRGITCQRIGYGQRDEQLHFDFHAEAAKAKSDDPEQWLKLTTEEKLDRKGLKKSIELGRVATEDDLKPVTDGEHDKGTENFGTYINRIVTLDGKLEREGCYADMTPEQIFELHKDFLPVVTLWAGFVKAMSDDLPEDLADELTADLATLNDKQS